jgi:UDP-N-acetyl-D-glucosamine dehydrogenase
MPEYIVERTTKILSKKFKKSINGAKVLLIGVAYKKNINDLRESPALGVIKKLEEDNAVISYYDPYIPEFVNNEKEYKSLKDLTKEELKEKDIVIIITDHTEINYEMVAKNAKAVFDTRNAIKDNSENVEKL